MSCMLCTSSLTLTNHSQITYKILIKQSKVLINRGTIILVLLFDLSNWGIFNHCCLITIQIITCLGFAIERKVQFKKKKLVVIAYPFFLCTYRFLECSNEHGRTWAANYIGKVVSLHYFGGIKSLIKQKWREHSSWNKSCNISIRCAQVPFELLFQKTVSKKHKAPHEETEIFAYTLGHI